MAIQARARTRMHTVLPSLARPACQSASGLQINRQLAKRACMRWQPHESENSRSCRTSRQGDGILPYRMTDTVCLSRKSLLTPDRFAATGGFLANRSELLVKRLDFGLRIEKMGVKQESLRFLHENWWTTTARHAYHGDVPNEGAKWKPRLIPDRNSPTEIPRPKFPDRNSPTEIPRPKFPDRNSPTGTPDASNDYARYICRTDRAGCSCGDDLTCRDSDRILADGKIARLHHPRQPNRLRGARKPQRNASQR